MTGFSKGLVIGMSFGFAGLFGFAYASSMLPNAKGSQLENCSVTVWGTHEFGGSYCPVNEVVVGSTGQSNTLMCAKISVKCPANKGDEAEVSQP